jgi:hypothetical protein
MKLKNCLVILAGSAIVLTSSGRCFAQDQLTRDGYAVTPKSVQTESGAPSLEQQIVVVYPSTYYESQPIGYKTTWADGVAASPRARQVMMENKYPTTAMGGGQFIAGEGTGGNVIVSPQGRRVFMESHLGIVPSRTYYQPRGVGYEVTSEYGIAAPPRAWKTMCENASNPEMIELR